ncbi:uncharacterized protein LOC134258672 isoform X2 [Saccostrea cucullata]
MLLRVFLLSFFASLVDFVSGLEEPTKCIIIQDKQALKLPKVPEFLTKNKDVCRHGSANWQGQESLQCGTSRVYIKSECVCTYHNVWEAMYHGHTSCPANEKSDSVLLLKCSDCEKYSLNNTGPCINGGILNCENDALAPDIQCDCPNGYSGMFCENEMQKVTRVCDRTLNKDGLQNCDSTKKECITYSEKKHYMFKCDEILPIGEENDLPLCNNTETVTETKHSSSESTDSTISFLEDDDNKPSKDLTSGTNGMLSSLLLIFLTNQGFYFLFKS